MGAQPAALPPRLFHGTVEPLEGPIRPGGYDGVFWTADNSAVAQTYIPCAGSTVTCSVTSYEMDYAVSPPRRQGSDSDPFRVLARRIGPVAHDPRYDEHGRLQSWKVPDGAVTYRQVCEYIERELGYGNRDDLCVGGDRCYTLLTDGWDDVSREDRIVAADFRKKGTLLIVEGHEQMRLLDISRGEGDLTDPQYHRLKIFEQAAADGYDGIAIDDFCQTKSRGNVGHRSWGFFAHAIPKLRIETIEACNFDWGPGWSDTRVTDTPEYAAWLSGRAEEAVHRQSAGAQIARPRAG